MEAWLDGSWTQAAAAGTIGASRIVLLPAPVRAQRWRLRVTGARGAVHIAGFGLHRSQA